MKDRLKQIRKATNLTQSAFADKIGTTQNTYANYEIGRRNPSNSVVNNICKTFNVNEEWLRTGQGDMFRKQTRNDEIADFINRIQIDDNSFKLKLVSMLAQMNEEEWSLMEDMVKKLAAENSPAPAAPISTITPEDLTVEQAENLYKSSLHSAKKTESYASSTTDDTNKKQIG